MGRLGYMATPTVGLAISDGAVTCVSVSVRCGMLCVHVARHVAHCKARCTLQGMLHIASSRAREWMSARACGCGCWQLAAGVLVGRWVGRNSYMCVLLWQEQCQISVT